MCRSVKWIFFFSRPARKLGYHEFGILQNLRIKCFFIIFTYFRTLCCIYYSYYYEEILLWCMYPNKEDDKSPDLAMLIEKCSPLTLFYFNAKLKINFLYSRRQFPQYLTLNIRHTFPVSPNTQIAKVGAVILFQQCRHTLFSDWPSNIANVSIKWNCPTIHYFWFSICHSGSLAFSLIIDFLTTTLSQSRKSFSSTGSGD